MAVTLRGKKQMETEPKTCHQWAGFTPTITNNGLCLQLIVSQLTYCGSLSHIPANDQPQAQKPTVSGDRPRPATTDNNIYVHMNAHTHTHCVKLFLSSVAVFSRESPVETPPLSSTAAVCDLYLVGGETTAAAAILILGMKSYLGLVIV